MRRRRLASVAPPRSGATPIRAHILCKSSRRLAATGMVPALASAPRRPCGFPPPTAGSGRLPSHAPPPPRLPPARPPLFVLYRRHPRRPADRAPRSRRAHPHRVARRRGGTARDAARPAGPSPLPAPHRRPRRPRRTHRVQPRPPPAPDRPLLGIHAPQRPRLLPQSRRRLLAPRRGAAGRRPRRGGQVVHRVSPPRRRRAAACWRRRSAGPRATSATVTCSNSNGPAPPSPTSPSKSTTTAGSSCACRGAPGTEAAWSKSNARQRNRANGQRALWLDVGLKVDGRDRPRAHRHPRSPEEPRLPAAVARRPPDSAPARAAPSSAHGSSPAGSGPSSATSSSSTPAPSTIF
jgi:hypothetical protein